MPELNLVEIFTDPLEEHKIPYIVTGSMASVIYGEPRLTHDVDLVLNLREADVDLFVTIFPLEKFYCPPPEAILLEIKREAWAHFNLIHHETGFKADCYIAGNHELHRWAFGHRRIVQISDTKSIAIAPPEYVIIRKLEFFREGESQKHIRDIQNMLKISPQLIDIKMIESYVLKLGLHEAWALASA